MRRIVALVLVTAMMLWTRYALPAESLDPRALSSIAVGFLLLAAYLLGDVLTAFKLPKITGYIIAGIVFGPHVTELLSPGTVKDLKLIDDLALTFIAIAAGGELRLHELRARRKAIVMTVLFQSLVVFVGVAAFVFAAASFFPFLRGKSLLHVFVVAALIGTFALARSPSSAIAIIRECKAHGPFTEMVLGVTVVMDVLIIVVFAIVVSVAQALLAPNGQMDFMLIAKMMLEIAASIGAGVILGWLMIQYISRVRVELIAFILGVAFLTTFGSRQLGIGLQLWTGMHFHLEPMLVCITAGFVVQNFSASGRIFLTKINHASLPIFVLFFAITGAALNVSALRATWVLALLIVVVRLLTLSLGGYLGTRLSGDPPSFSRWSGAGYVTQAGVSLGLAAIVMKRFPDWGPAAATLIVAVITVNQIVGPAAMKLAFDGVGESREASRRRDVVEDVPAVGDSAYPDDVDLVKPEA